MSDWRFDLAALDDGLGLPEIASLPSIAPCFFIPPLLAKPPDPIGASIEEERVAESDEVSVKRSQPSPGRLPPDTDSIWWSGRLESTASTEARIASWDALCSSSPSKGAKSSFLSEQDSHAFASMRYITNPPLDKFTGQHVYVSENNLIRSLALTVLGNSSPLYRWDALFERFVAYDTSTGGPAIILLDGGDRDISDSICSRFLTIGTLLRRLEIFTGTIASSEQSTTAHTFVYAISSIVRHLRQTLARRLSPQNYPSDSSLNLSATWMDLVDFEEALTSLAILCQREVRQPPQAYLVSSFSAPLLLSRIYDCLSAHFENKSPAMVIALVAYLLTTSSGDFLHSVCVSVGFCQDTVRKGLHTEDIIPNGSHVSDTNNGDETGHGEELSDDPDEPDAENKYPKFFLPVLSQALPRARRSLKLLKNACPTHSLFFKPPSATEIGWIWTHDAISSAWNECSYLKGSSVGGKVVNPQHESSKSRETSSPLERIVAQFGEFDRNPGAVSASSTPSTSVVCHVQSDLSDFLSTFPDSLPSLAPTLSDLTSLVLSPLVQHIGHLSNALLSIFLSTSSILNVQGNLILLRSYLLFTADSFRSRFVDAIFSDSIYSKDDDMRILARTRRTIRSPMKTSNEWISPAIGLAPSLFEQGSWPPGGADLSFHLRTVIVDSLEKAYSAEDLRNGSSRSPDLSGALRKVFQEAESRLGFALRDLPVGPGRDRWLDPLSIEALDFLYMDYKPPEPLKVVFTSEILSKYQRVSAFMMRLMRVECAVRTVFRMVRVDNRRVFSNLPRLNKLLLHFRYLSHSMVTSLSHYVFDVVIRGSFDVFVCELDEGVISSAGPFSDVFALANAHSTLLDDMLSACLLRSGQRAVGDLLRGILEVILEFTALTGRVWSSELQEYEAAPLLEDLYGDFRNKTKTFMKVLRGVIEKRSLSKPYVDSSSRSDSVSGSSHHRLSSMEMLHQLFLRLDIYDWWTH